MGNDKKGDGSQPEETSDKSADTEVAQDSTEIGHEKDPHVIPFYREETPLYPPDEIIEGDGTDDVLLTAIYQLRTLGMAIIRNIHATPFDELLERPDFEGLVLDPMDIYRSIHCFLKDLSQSETPEKVEYYFEQLVKRHPIIAYIYHMEMSGHSLAFLNLMKELKERFGYTFDTPFCDLGCGPGHMLWHLLEVEDMIPFGRVVLVDNNHAFMSYAKELMSWKSEGFQAGLHDFHFFESDAGKVNEMAAAENVKFRTVYSSLVLQWVEDPDAVIKSIYESMVQGGIFVLIVEDPPNITATTPISFINAEKDWKKFTVGFDNGRPCQEILRKCQEAGFVLENYLARHMGMCSAEEISAFIGKIGELDKKGWDNMTGDEQKEYAYMLMAVKNYHVALAVVLRKPDSAESGG